MDPELEIVTIGSHDDEGLLDEFHGGIYWDAFPDQQEPVAVWKRALWGGRSPYELTIRVAGHRLRDRAHRELLGGIAFERYPRSGCGLVTYMAIAPAARRQGLGKRLQREAVLALFGAGVRAVLGEVNDPRLAGEGVDEPVEAMWRRLERNQAWGARVLNVRYVQPALAPGLARDHGLCLIALAGEQPLADAMPGEVVRDFVHELYEVTEGNPPDRELVAQIPDRVELFALTR
ncbi:MAG TPA: GNAT family N-acetyltransferase [Kofleriaceae bacterium]|nr:GNAT family N-acetyltransferase [Kofleriaceae bacterium]